MLWSSAEETRLSEFKSGSSDAWVFLYQLCRDESFTSGSEAIYRKVELRSWSEDSGGSELEHWTLLASFPWCLQESMTSTGDWSLPETRPDLRLGKEGRWELPLGSLALGKPSHPLLGGKGSCSFLPELTGSELCLWQWVPSPVAGFVIWFKGYTLMKSGKNDSPVAIFTMTTVPSAWTLPWLNVSRDCLQSSGWPSATSSWTGYWAPSESFIAQYQIASDSSLFPGPTWEQDFPDKDNESRPEMPQKTFPQSCLIVWFIFPGNVSTFYIFSD